MSIKPLYCGQLRENVADAATIEVTCGCGESKYIDHAALFKTMLPSIFYLFVCCLECDAASF